MANTLVPKKLGARCASEFVSTVDNTSAFYVYAGRHMPYANSGDATITTPVDSVEYNTYEAYNNMVFGKKVSNTDVIEMAPRYDWQSGNVYTQYDDQSSTLHSNQFYAVVNAGSQYHVYKCLYNNYGANSTVEPSGTSENAFETPSDGYIWKYIYSANSTNMTKFATSSHLPVTPNTSITAAAVDGAIEVMVVESAGLGYDNYMNGVFESSDDLRIDGDATKYSLGANGSGVADFYNGCLMLMTSGAAQNEYRVVTDYEIVGSQKIVTLESAFTSAPATNDTFEIYPYVYTTDTGGSKTINCIARAIVNSSSGNSIASIEVLTPGAGYRAATAQINASSSVGVTANAVVRPIISPPGGHGSDVVGELGANYVGISVSFVDDEEAISEENDFRQVGVLKDPMFANVQVAIVEANAVGAFVGSELVYEYRAYPLTGTVSINATSAQVNGTSTSFDAYLRSGDYVLISDGDNNHFGQVNTVTNSTVFTVSSNGGFANSGCTLSYLTVGEFGYVSSVGTGTLNFANVTVNTHIGSNNFVGSESYATATVNTIASPAISVNGRAVNNYNTYTHLKKFVGTLDSGTFVEDELITQGANGTTQPSGRIHSFVENGANDELYMTNVLNTFNTGQTVTGANSGAVFTINTKIVGDLEDDTGDVIYMENVNPISRSNTTTETIKLILEF